MIRSSRLILKLRRRYDYVTIQKGVAASASRITVIDIIKIHLSDLQISNVSKISLRWVSE